VRRITHPRWIPALAVAVSLAFLGGLAASAVAGITWGTAKLLNSWTYGGFSSAYPGYAKDPLGVAHLRGSVVNGPEGDEAFIMPKALAPSHELWLSITTPGVGGRPDPEGLAIATTGQVLPVGIPYSTPQSLDSVSFVTSGSKIKFTKAALENGWQYGGQSSAQPGYAIDSRGVVYLHGGMTGGASRSTAFVLPPALAPSHNMWLPIYTTGANIEESLEIMSDGEVIPIGTAGGNVGNYSSLDGISFVAHSSKIKFTAAKLLNNFNDGAYGSAAPGYAKDSEGIVHLEGALSGQGSGHIAFYLPQGLRPSHQLVLEIYTYEADSGALDIKRNGAVIPHAYGSEVQHYASLDGVSFVPGQ
jgi:hypothetical protein